MSVVADSCHVKTRSKAVDIHTKSDADTIQASYFFQSLSKYSRISLKLDVRSYYSVDRHPSKFHRDWSSFDNQNVKPIAAL